MDGARWKLDAVGVYHQHVIQDQAGEREPLGRPASSGRWWPARGSAGLEHLRGSIVVGVV